MFRYLYYAVQSLTHRAGSNVIKVVSLSLGLLVSVFLFARIAFELSFDNFYREADKLYQVKTGWLKDGVAQGKESVYTLIPVPATIAEEYPDRVEGATVCCTLFDDDYRLGDRRVKLQTVMGDTLFFPVMGLDVLEGNPQDLANPDVVFLSESGARSMFGSEDPLGKTVSYDIWGEEAVLLVKGIFRDVPLNTSLEKRPEAVVSFATIGRHTRWATGWNSGGNYNGFVRLRSSSDAAWLNERLTAAIARHLPPGSGLELSVHIAPLRSAHLDNPQVRKMVGIMAFLGTVLLLVTAFNYVLVSVSSLTGRAKAIGVHKCSGAGSGSIFGMFLLETALVVAMALALAVVLVLLFRDSMEELAGVPLDVLFAPAHLYAPFGVVALLLAVGGCLPAGVFARIPVTQVFRRYTSGRRGWKRTLLVVQFAGVAFVLGMLLVVAVQYYHLTERDRGWNPDRVAIAYRGQLDGEQLCAQLRHLPYVESVASSNCTMQGFVSNRQVCDAQGNELFFPRNAWFTADYLPFIGLRLKEGHNLTGSGQLLVNSAFCQRMGWTDSPIGRRVNDYGTVVGLLDSFAFPAGVNDAEPVMVEWCEGVGTSVSVRLKEPADDNLRRLNEDMARIWPQGNLVFRSMEQDISRQANAVRIFRNVVLLSSVAILFIVLMGLIGYVNDEIRLRSKEIAIRKVNGAGRGHVLWLLLREVLWLSVPSVLAGVLAARWAGRVWMERFSDAAALSGALYALLAILLLGLVSSAVVLKAWQIANENPVLSIKSE